MKRMRPSISAIRVLGDGADRLTGDIDGTDL